MRAGRFPVVAFGLQSTAGTLLSCPCWNSLAFGPGLFLSGVRAYVRSMWTRRRTMIAGRDDGDNDWEVFRDGRQVGRIYATMLPEPERSWMWFIQFGQPAQGYAESMEAALDEVRRRCG